MYCNNDMHKELAEDGYVKCLFCDQHVGKQMVKNDVLQ